MSRHSARETAMQIIFQLEVGKNTIDMAKLTLENANLDKIFADFAWSLVEGVEANLADIDEYIAKFTKEWDLGRLANVDKTVVRLAIYELLYSKATPPKIVINEAIELAKFFSTDEAPSFINAVLDGFYHKVVVEDQPDYRIDEKLKAERTMLAAENEAQAAKLAAADALEIKEVKPIKEVEKKIKKTGQFDAKKKIVDGKAYRIIKKTEITPDDIIKEENIFEDKKRIFGADAFLTPGDIRKATLEGIKLPANFATAPKPDAVEIPGKTKFKKDAYSQFKKAEPKKGNQKMGYRTKNK